MEYVSFEMESLGSKNYELDFTHPLKYLMDLDIIVTSWAMEHVIAEYLLHSLCHITTERLLRDACFIKLSETKYLFSFSYACLLFGIFSTNLFWGSKAGELFKCTYNGNSFAGYMKKTLRAMAPFLSRQGKGESTW